MKKDATAATTDKLITAMDQGAVHIVLELASSKKENHLMSLVEHATRELALLDNDERFNQCIIKAVESFMSYGHSGGSVGYGIHILTDLLYAKNLSPLTDDPDEWMEITEDTWQSRRRADAFSYDGGKSYHVLGEKNKVIQTAPHKEKKDANG